MFDESPTQWIGSIGSENNFTCMSQGMNLYNHPGFQCLRQVDEFEYSWTNPDSHLMTIGIPWGTNIPPNMAQSRFKGSNRANAYHDIAKNNMMLQFAFNDTNTYGGMTTNIY